MPTEETGGFVAPAVTTQVSRKRNNYHFQLLMLKCLHLLLLAGE